MAITLKRAGLRILLYFGLAFAFLVVCGLLVLFSVRTGVTDPGPWIFLTLYTVVLAWATVSTSKQYWRRPAYWLVVASLLALHVLGFIAVLRAYPEWRPMWYIPVVIVEAGIFGMILTMLFSRKAR